MKRSLLIALGMGASLLSSAAMAGSGIIDISQACAPVGCFAGDAPGFPVTINSPGSYELTSNLQVTGSDAIQITASGAQLDLRGFVISGPVTCSGSPAVCTPSSATNSFSGVVASATTDAVTIKNGVVRGFSVGLYSSRNGLVENITSRENSDSGVFGREGAVVRRATADSNGRLGIEIKLGGTVVESSASDNGQFGIATGGVPNNGGATVRNSSAYRNGGWGIYDWGRSLIEGCTVNSNGGAGIEVANGGSSISNTVVTGNAGPGITFTGGVAFEAGGVATSFRGVTLTGNNGGSANAQLGGGGARVNAGGNLCGAAACP